MKYETIDKFWDLEEDAKEEVEECNKILRDISNALMNEGWTQEEIQKALRKVLRVQWTRGLYDGRYESDSF